MMVEEFETHEQEKWFFERVGEAGKERFGKALGVAESDQSKASKVLQM